MPRYANDVRFTQEWYSPAYPTTIEEVEASWPFFKQRAAFLASEYPDILKIAIAGAGFGATAYYLYVNHGKDPYCCDIAYATTKSANTMKGISTRMSEVDVLDAAACERWRRAHNTGKTKFPLIFTEDLLPCTESEIEVQTMLTNLRAIGDQLIHLISPKVPENSTTDMLWRTSAEWRALIGPNERIVLPNLTEVP